MRAIDADNLIVSPTLDYMEQFGIGYDDRARYMLLAIAQQESSWKARVQGGGGPARSYWQFELGGGVKGVLAHHVTGPIAAKALAGIDQPTDPATVYAAMAENDVLGCIMARLLLYSDPRALPAIGDRQATWDCYQRNWRPGKPGPERWPAAMAVAMATMEANKA